MTNIVWFNDVNKHKSIIGTKALNLATLYNEKFPVPYGFIITNNAFNEFINPLQRKINDVLVDINIENKEQLQHASNIIQDFILEQQVPNSISRDIIEAYNNISIDTDILLNSDVQTLKFIRSGRDSSFVALRSSSNIPSSTFINVKGKNNIVQASLQSWTSLFSPESIAFKIKNNIDIQSSLIVQKMINPEKSGLVLINDNEIIINAGFGLGDAIVTNSVSSDNYVLDKSTLQLKSFKINKQEYKLNLDEFTGKTIKKDLHHNGEEQKLREDEIKKIANLAKDLFSYYKKPLELEFCLERRKVFVIHSRLL